MSQNITCIITGKTITVSDEYYDKKIKEYGTEENFKNLYTSRQAKSLLKRGYKLKEVRNLLRIDESIPEVSDKIIKQILSINDDENNSFKYLNIKKSDPDVVEYIEALR